MEIHISWLENADSSNTTRRCIKTLLQKILIKHLKNTDFIYVHD